MPVSVIMNTINHVPDAVINAIDNMTTTKHNVYPEYLAKVVECGTILWRTVESEFMIFVMNDASETGEFLLIIILKCAIIA